MNRARDPRRYREEAALFRELAAAAVDSAELRDSYLGLALQYERVAQLLEQSAAAVAGKPDSTDAYTGPGGRT
jgi:hypothetical protein